MATKTLFNAVFNSPEQVVRFLLCTLSTLVQIYTTKSCLRFIRIEQGSLLKPKRIRTTFSEDQLQILNANFNLDPNPDGHDLERIAKQTGLSKRVTQVWFQNSRARQKKQSSNSGNYSVFTCDQVKYYFNLGVRNAPGPA